MYLLKILFFILVSLPHKVLSQSLPFHTIVLPVMKDTNTSLHKVTLSFTKPTWNAEPSYLIDLDAPFTWKDCVVGGSDPCWFEKNGCTSPWPCHHSYCREARSYDPNPICPSLNVTVKYGCSICVLTPVNPISNTCKFSQLTNDEVALYVTNGRNPYRGTYTSPVRFLSLISCAPSSLLRSFPKNVHGVATFSWSTLAFPRQLGFLRMADKFALCLSGSSSALWVTFLGDGPFYFTASPNLDVKTILSYTPMIQKSSKSLRYYIKINRISINGTPIYLRSLKSESVKLSTIVPYTTLRSDIYKDLLIGFSKATKNIPRVNVVKPFSLCLKSSAIGSVSKGFRVPNIDLETESGKVCTISGDNSMKRTGNGTACLAFIDGGSRVKDAVMIGTFQIENNFLFFYLENQKLGFSSSLLARGNLCSSFNFTEIPI